MNGFTLRDGILYKEDTLNHFKDELSKWNCNVVLIDLSNNKTIVLDDETKAYLIKKYDELLKEM